MGLGWYPAGVRYIAPYTVPGKLGNRGRLSGAQLPRAQLPMAQLSRAQFAKSPFDYHRFLANWVPGQKLDPGPGTGPNCLNHIFSFKTKVGPKTAFKGRKKFKPILAQIFLPFSRPG